MSKKISDKIIDDAVNEKELKKEEISKQRLFTGSTLRDYILGNGRNELGVKVGVIYNIIGISSSGKTFELNELVATNRKIYGDKFKWNYDSTAENGNDIDCKKLYGFDVVTDDSIRSRTVEDLSVNIKKFLKNLKDDEIGCYMVDSLDGLISKEIDNRIKEREKAYEKGKEFDEGSYLMQRAKFLKQEFFPDIKPLIEKSNCLLIIVSQQSKKVGVTFGSTKDRAGGDALRFFAHIESWTRKVDEITVTRKGYEFVLGIRSKIDFTKTRNERNFRYHYNTIYFDYGIDDLSDNLDFLFDLLTEQGKDKSGKDLKIKFKDEIFTSKKELRSYIEQNNLEQEIKEMVLDKWEELEESIKIERKRKF